MYDVIVVGAGPAGSHLAQELGKKGRHVIVIERKTDLTERICCTGIVGSDCVRGFDIDSNVIIREMRGARIFSPSGKSLRFERKTTQACILNRGALNISLASRARCCGVEYLLGSDLQSVEIKSEKVVARSIFHGEEVVLQARALVLASGFSPAITDGLGLGRIADFVAGGQVEAETARLDEIEVYLGQEIAPGFFGWLVPTMPGRALVGLMSRRNPGLHLERLISSLRREGKIISVDAKPGFAFIPLKPLRRTYASRVLVVGGAAGQVKPTTGGGIFYGMLGADIAADTLIQALETDDLSARSLSVYERRWKKKFGWELKVGYWARRLYERLSDRQIDNLIDIINSNGIADSINKSENLSFDWHGEILLRALGQGALSEAMGVIKLPLRLTRR